jgi:hypothetical protein
MIDPRRDINRYFGKYRGVVTANKDPNGLGRIQAKVPDVVGNIDSQWAIPCLPVAGKIAPEQAGIFVLPPVDGNVWIEFEQGDPARPIWVGSYPDNVAQIPQAAGSGTEAAPAMVLQTAGQNVLILAGDLVTGITISAGPTISATSPNIKISTSGIKLSDGMGGTIEIAYGVVRINGSNLVISK